MNPKTVKKLQAMYDFYCNAYRMEDMRTNPHFYTPKTGKITRQYEKKMKGRHYNKFMDFAGERAADIYNRCLDIGVKLEHRTGEQAIERCSSSRGV